ncbi:uncharacterized protein LOC126558026 [Anopheles maculipalpis]|uniref:uncharacterized protein LOC126558026 n=1 Tax=Anopheles maculipalpis TaxID=1496333 RepID=UPI0021599474|nr:uncharacterized protein LOC126558026 [Anopheles maculipalpis]
MWKTMAPTRSVHFIDSETISKQIFAPARYNLPLFLCQKLNVNSTSGEKSAQRQCLKQHERTALLQRMAKYHIKELTKGKLKVKEMSFKISQPKLSILGRVRRRCNKHRIGWPDCPKPLRDGRKDWSLPPGRYRLGGSIADLANRSTGPNKGRHGHPTKGNARRRQSSLYAKLSATSGSASVRHPDTISAIYLPAEMNKLLHPSKYFVGKIRPGDRMNDRPTLRLAISELTVCRRDPNAPGPGHYHPEQQTRTHNKVGKTALHPPVCCYTYDQYCREPFFRPPPGRYDIRDALPPIPASHRAEQIHIPIQSTSSKPHSGDGHDARPAVPPVRRKVTLRLNSINIPVRPRKGRRNMKVAFMSGSARFRDRDFFPIGGLGKATARKQQSTTSKKSHDSLNGAQLEPSRSGSGTRAFLPSEQVDRTGSEGKRREKESEDCIRFLAAHGISQGKLLPPSKAGNKISTRFFTVPKLMSARR